MSHSLSKIWVHAVWTTKYREPVITPSLEKILYPKMRAEFMQLRCPVKIINGAPDHVHCLFKMNASVSIADTIKQVKGSSSRYVNEYASVPGRFSWQEGYGAFSVSESALEKVFEYIQNQKVHHGIPHTPYPGMWGVGNQTVSFFSLRKSTYE
ncbi:MAG: IS200/IS605 family transposase [Bacteroidetes bacterium]|nr:IS200/IS605 family transposase [Bacteroidota bacterium]